MKTIKIGLAAIVLAAISLYVIQSFIPTDEVGEIQQSGNPFIDKIQHEIKILQLKPENMFCKDYYNEVAYHIDDYHKSNRLGKSKLENDQWKDNLSKQLYAAYADKFIRQAYHVFSHSDWNGNDLNFIRSEYSVLQSSPLLERNNPIDRRFNETKSILSKYDEIIAFISSCKGFSYFETGIDKRFPLDEVRSKILRAEIYRDKNLENSYVNNCARLHNELKVISQSLFRAHCAYLEKKITYWAGAYSGYSSQKTYNDNVWAPLNNEIEALDNEVYAVSDFDREYSRLKQKWQAEGTSAYNYFT